jgi:hypothetical protein
VAVFIPYRPVRVRRPVKLTAVSVEEVGDIEIMVVSQILASCWVKWGLVAKIWKRY